MALRIQFWKVLIKVHRTMVSMNKHPLGVLDVPFVTTLTISKYVGDLEWAFRFSFEKHSCSELIN